MHAGSAEDEAILDRLRGALTLFEGTHPFHNYTKRRLYRAEARENAERKVSSPSKTHFYPGNFDPQLASGP